MLHRRTEVYQKKASEYFYKNLGKLKIYQIKQFLILTNTLVSHFSIYFQEI